MSRAIPEEVRITAVRTLRCGAGFRDFCFVKIETDGVTPDNKPLVGWSEYLEERNIGITQVIEWMGQLCLGKDPLPYGKIVAQLKANTRHIAGGLAGQGIAAIENGLLDIVGKVYGVPVCALFGGPIRCEIPTYWSHCGSFRVSFSDVLVNPATGRRTPPLRSLQDVTALGKEVVRSGFKSMKTNIFIFGGEGKAKKDKREKKGKNVEGGNGSFMYMPGFGGGEGTGSPELNCDPDLVDTVVKQMRTFRQACGDRIGLKLDLNYNFRTEGFIQMAKALTPEALGGRGIDWLELDSYSPSALRQIRDAAPMPIASLESLIGRRALLPFLQAGAVDVAIIDPLWNGCAESVKMAELCDTFDVNCAAHNYHGWLGTVICAHFCAAIPNLKVLEMDWDDVPWKDDIVTSVPLVQDGVLHLPLGPGWGIEVDEEALKKHPPMNDAKTGIWSEAAGAGAAATAPNQGKAPKQGKGGGTDVVKPQAEQPRPASGNGAGCGARGLGSRRRNGAGAGQAKPPTDNIAFSAAKRLKLDGMNN